jgi:hypothetical protein
VTRGRLAATSGAGGGVAEARCVDDEIGWLVAERYATPRQGRVRSLQLDAVALLAGASRSLRRQPLAALAP